MIMKKARSLAFLLAVVFILSIVFAIPAQAKSLSSPKSLKAATVTANSITLTWKSVKNATSYEVQKYNSKKKKYVKLAAIKETSYTVKGLTDNTTYKFRVRALRGKTKGAFSSKVTVKTKALPAAPTGLKITLASYGFVSCSWNSVDGVTSYKLYYSKSADGPYTFYNEFSNNYAYMSGLDMGAEYYIKVSSVSQYGEGKQSGYVKAATTTYAIPQP